MFEALLDRIEFVPIEESELDQIFSVDAEGRAITLREYMSQHNERMAKLGPAAAAARDPGSGADAGAHSLSADEVNRLVEEYLGAFEEDEVLRIMGRGAFTADELREHVRQGTPVGERVIEIAVEGHIFMEEAIKRGKAKVVSKKH